MNTEKAYAELLRQKKAAAIGKPLLGAWEFLPSTFHFPVSKERRDLAELEMLSKWHDWQMPISLKRVLQNGKTLLITDGEQRIEFVSAQFEHMTGYSAEEARGKKPSFLQGKETASATLVDIRLAVEKKQGIKTELINYKKNGDPYLCEIEILPLFTSKGMFSHFLALEQEKSFPFFRSRTS